MGYKNIYFIGIGGIGMSAIARYYHAKGLNVSGYDKTPSELTHSLEAEGIAVHYTDDISYIPQNTEDTLIIYTPAVPEDLNEMIYVREKGYRVIKRSRMLGEISKGQRCLAVAGTHGKTTTSTMLAHILNDSGEGCSAFLGGISKNYDTNLLISENATIVAEADEFDRSFLQLFPETAVITSMDADHLDIYSDIENMHSAFREFASQVSGTVITKIGLPLEESCTKAKVMRYSYDNKEADFHAENISVDECGYFTFDLVWPEGVIERCSVGVPGWINVENGIAAAAVALTYGIKPEAVKAGLCSFQGVRRRFDIHVNTARCSYIDDYAHHPKEIAAAVSSIRDIFPGRKLTAVFQPHLYTRTRDFAEDFALALSKVDKLILLDIYPAREEPIPGVSSEIIFDRVRADSKVIIKKEELMDYLKDEDIDILITFGAGNIDRFINPITELLKTRLCTRQ